MDVLDGLGVGDLSWDVRHDHGRCKGVGDGDPEAAGTRVFMASMMFRNGAEAATDNAGLLSGVLLLVALCGGINDVITNTVRSVNSIVKTAYY